VLRTLRLLRPLRTLKRVAGIKRLVDCLFESLPGLVNVAAMILCGGMPCTSLLWA
jgi:hypothetical protein